VSNKDLQFLPCIPNILQMTLLHSAFCSSHMVTSPDIYFKNSTVYK